MKQRYFYLTLFVALMATLVTGCKKEEGTVTLGAVIQKPANSKVYIDDHTPCWHNGDEVYINNTAYPVIAALGATARIENVVSSNAYRAIFPASIIADGTDIRSSSSIPVTLPATQQYQLVGSHQLVDIPMGAYITSGSTLQFYNLCSIVRVIVSNSLNQELPLRSIELQAQTAKLSGAGAATVTGQSSDCITLSSSARNNVNLTFTNDCPATVEARGTSTFDIVVPAFSTNIVTISLYTTDGYMFSLPKEGVSLEHNTITTVTLNVTALAEAPHAELVDGPTFNAAIPDEATSVVFEYNSSVTSGTLLSTADSPVPIYGNLDGTTWRVSTSDSKINANPNSSSMFRASYHSDIQGYLPALSAIDFGDGFITSNVRSMDAMFYICSSLTSLDLSNFNTANVTNMRSMFDHCSSLTSLNLSNFITDNVTNMNYMFSYCSSLTSLNLSNFITTTVTEMYAMFSNCSSLTSLNLSNFNTANVTSMSLMFAFCTSLTNLNLSNFNNANVGNMYGMFYNCSSLTSLNLSNFNTANVTIMDGMFSGCSSLTSLNLSNFNTANVTNMNRMFYNCSSLTNLNLSNFNTANVTNMNRMFYNCSSLTSLNLSNFYTTSVNNMQAMFMNCYSLTNLNLAHFDMSHLTSHSYYTGGTYQTLSGKYDMCNALSTTSHNCTITCPLDVQTEIQSGTNLPTSGVSFTWVRP